MCLFAVTPLSNLALFYRFCLLSSTFTGKEIAVMESQSNWNSPALIMRMLDEKNIRLATRLVKSFSSLAYSLSDALAALEST